VEEEAIMSKVSAKKLVGVGSYHEWEVKELRRDKEFAIGCLQLSMESLTNPEERAGALLSLRAIAEAYGGLGKIAAEAGISRESLYRSLSPKGNPTLKTLVAVLNAVGMRLSVVAAQSKKSAQPKSARRSIAA
jgi:probable addiction module antidote protein